MNRRQMIKMLDELKDILAHATMTGAMKRDDKYAGAVLNSVIQEALEKEYIEHAAWMDFAIGGPSEASIAAAMLSSMLRAEEGDMPSEVRLPKDEDDQEDEEEDDEDEDDEDEDDED